MPFRSHMVRTTWMFLLAALCPAILAAAGQTFDGTTVGQPSFDRPDEFGSGLSGEVVQYQAQAFQLESAAACDIYSVQSYNGYIHLYDGGFVPGSPLSNLLEGDDDGNLGPGSSELRSLDLDAGTYTIVTSAATAGDVGTFQNSVHCVNAQPIHGGCSQYQGPAPKEQQTCAHERFTLSVTGISNHPSNGIGTPVRFGSTDSSIFWFYRPTNYELMVKVLNACAINDRYWVFLGGLTNQAYTLKILDNLTGTVRTYSNTVGVRAPAITDTDAFDCSP